MDTVLGKHDMTIGDKAREIVLLVQAGLNENEAIEYVRAHLAAAHAEGWQCGVESARQVINEMSMRKDTS